MKIYRVMLNGETVSGEAYIELIKYLCRKSDCLQYKVLRDIEERADAVGRGYNPDRILDDEEKRYLAATEKTTRFFLNHIIKKEKGRSNITYFVSLKHVNAEQILLKTGNILYWSYPDDVEDLCFYKNGVCTFCSVTHEDYFALFTNDELEAEHIEKIGCEVIYITECDAYEVPNMN